MTRTYRRKRTLYWCEMDKLCYPKNYRFHYISGYEIGNVDFYTLHGQDIKAGWNRKMVYQPERYKEPLEWSYPNTNVILKYIFHIPCMYGA